MKTSLKRLAIFMIILFVAVPFRALAQGSVTYDGNAKKFIFAPGTTDHPTDLFDGFKGVMPGDTLTQFIDIKNQELGGKVTLYVRAKAPQAAATQFLGKLQLQVKLEGEKLLFSAPADATAGLTDWVCLGTFYAGGTTRLDLTLSVPIDLDDEFQHAQGSVIWEFRADELPLQPGDPGYKTGEAWLPWFLGVVCLLSLSMAWFLLLLRKKQSDEEN